MGDLFLTPPLPSQGGDGQVPPQWDPIFGVATNQIQGLLSQAACARWARAAEPMFGPRPARGARG
eukprot:7776800-Alexandrium_andersonii.AAC.1